MWNHIRLILKKNNAGVDKSDIDELKELMKGGNSDTIHAAPNLKERAHKREFISSNLALQVVENALTSQYESEYRTDGAFIYIDIYSTDTRKKIDNMSITVDLSGHVFRKTPKFWPSSDNIEPVDFMPALNLTNEAITAYWNGIGNFSSKDYCMTDQLAELNRRLELVSVNNWFQVKKKQEK